MKPDTRKLTPRRAFELLRKVDQYLAPLEIKGQASHTLDEVRKVLADHVTAAINPKRRRAGES